MRSSRFLLSLAGLMSLIVFAVVSALLLVRFSLPHPLNIGPASQYPPAATPYRVDTDGDPLYLVNIDSKIRVFHPQTPASSRCRYYWGDYEYGDYQFGQPSNLRRASAFIDPCSGSRFALDGRYLFGPAHRGLDSYPLRIENSHIFIDMSQVIEGPPNPLIEEYPSP